MVGTTNKSMAAMSGAWYARRSAILGWRPLLFDQVLGNTRLRDFKPQLEQFAVDAWRTPKRIFDAHPPNQHTQLCLYLRSPSQAARLPLPVAVPRNPAPCQRTSVSGRMIVRTCKIDGNQRYSWMKNQRSLFVSRTRPRC